MDTWLTLLGSAVAGGIAVLALRSKRQQRSQDAREIDRFVLRVRARSTDGEPVRLGTSVETASVPSSTPTLTSVEVSLEDDADNIVVLPAQTSLMVRAFDGARRLPIEAVTTSDGTAQRFSFDVPQTVRFWILDAPSWFECLSTADPRRRRLPPRSEGYEVTTRGPPKPAPDEHGYISVLMADLTMPLWMHGFEGPDGWLVGARSPTEPTVAIADFNDPSRGDDSARKVQTGGAAILLSDAVWLRTNARATVGIPLALTHARVFTTEGLQPWEDLAVWRKGLAEAKIFVWGAARADLSTEGYDVRMRAPSDAEARAISGPIASIESAMIAALHERGIADAAPSRIAPLPIELEGAYLAVCDLLCLMILSHPNNQALPKQEPAVQRKIVDLAKDLFDAAPTFPLACLMWIVSAIYAYDCGGLSTEQREVALEFVRAQIASAPGDPVGRLGPAILFRLGESGEAVTACRAALAEASGPGGYRGDGAATVAYRAWLEKVLAKASAT